jgi:tetratricopeptide (TPR) repeat protein
MSWLEEVKAARARGSYEDAMAILHRELDLRPTDAQVYYQIAWTCDALGKEADAAPAYEQAIAAGLEGEDLKGAYLGLGSTYRCLGDYQKSRGVFERARKKFPEDRALAAFQALTLFNLGKHEESVGNLVKLLAETSSDPAIQRYQRALLFYSDRLTETFE